MKLILCIDLNVISLYINCVYIPIWMRTLVAMETMYNGYRGNWHYFHLNEDILCFTEMFIETFSKRLMNFCLNSCICLITRYACKVWKTFKKSSPLKPRRQISHDATDMS